MAYAAAATTDYAMPARRRANGTDNVPSDPVRSNWHRYEYVKQRGHADWCQRVRRLEQYYLGGGLQWLPEDRSYMEETLGIKCIEVNEIAEGINNALAYQLNNRLDIQFKPRGHGASEEVAKTLSKVAKQIADNNDLAWTETQVYGDGLIQHRGYYDLSLSFDDSLYGEARVSSLDPMDVIPDPDAKTYNPDGWADVCISRWYTIDEIETTYGPEAAQRVRDSTIGTVGERDFGEAGGDEVERNHFGDDEWAQDTAQDTDVEEGGIRRFRIIDRQFWVMTMSHVVVFPTGDFRTIHNPTPQKLAYWRSKGCIVMQRPARRVRRSVTTYDAVLFDDWSPFRHFTVIAFFCYFRRGKTKGMIDDAVGPQDLLNKSLTKETQILSTVAQSGYYVEQNSLTNMDVDELEEFGGRNGIVLEYRKGSTPPKKIDPSQVPTGIDRLATVASEKIGRLTGNTSSMRGEGGANQSGTSVQSQQFAAQMARAVPQDNLSRSHTILARHLLEIVQDFYDEPRIMRISQTDPLSGRESTEELRINWQDEAGQVLNDLTLGEYDVVVAEVPAQITYENSQYQQALEMRKEGVMIPDPYMIRNSTLNDKAEIIEQMTQNQGKPDPVTEAKIALDQARAALAEAQAVNVNVQALFSAIRTSQIQISMPQTAGVADGIAKSAGFTDKDGGTIYGNPQQALTAGEVPTPPPPSNTNPSTPDHAARGADTGIEAGPGATP